MNDKSSVNKAGYWAIMVSLILMISKALGFYREMLIAYGFGASKESDAYIVAYNGIIILVGLIGSGLNNTLIPIFSDIKHHLGKKAKDKYFANILTITLLVTFVLALLIFILARPYATILAYGYTGDMHEIIVYLIRMGLPLILFLGITYVSNAYLQSDEIYAPHAFMGIPYNLVFIIYLLVTPHPTVYNLMIATIIASTMQFFVQLPALRYRKLGFKFDLTFHDPYIKRTFTIIMPIILSSAVYQLNLLIDKSLASNLMEGSISVLNYATKVNTLVVSVFVVAITSVIFPKLNNAIHSGRKAEVGELFSSSLSFVSLVSVPACIGMISLAGPIVKVLFERGKFDETASIMTAGALMFYAPGLIGQSLRMSLENIFYSHQNSKTPMLTGIISVIINVTLNFIFISFLQHRGLALATSVASISSSLILYIIIRKKIEFNEKRFFSNFIKIFISSIIMGLSAKFLFGLLAKDLLGGRIYALILILVIIIAVLVYAILLYILGVREIKELIRAIAKKIRR